MNVRYSKRFIKNYKLRIKGNRKLESRFKQRLALLSVDPRNPILKLHRLKGDKSTFYAFSITGDFRAIVTFEDDYIFLHNIGTHSQVY